MADNLFGFSIKPKVPEKQLPSFTPPNEGDGVYEATGNVLRTSLDYNESYKNENDLINRYREMALAPEVDSAIDDIVNETISSAEADAPVKINLDALENEADNIKEKIIEEFDVVLSLLEFTDEAYDIIRRWYVDGRLYYHIMIDPANPRLGIQELRQIDPRKIRKVREIITNRQVPTEPNMPDIVSKVIEYFVYNVRGAGGIMGLKVAEDSVAFIDSGLIDYKTNMILSWLHKAIKPLNQLKYLEDAAVIYRLSRAPERRVFKIDVGNLPRAKAEAYINDIMSKYRTKLTYDPATGDVKDMRRQLSMLEDFWLPVRDGRGTEIDTLEGGQQLGEMTDIEYFRRKLYKSLNVPVSRLESNDTIFNNRTTEITRDELKFARFIKRLQLQFSSLFDQLLRVQLILKGVLSDEDWERIRDKVYYDFVEDNRFAEIKEIEAINDRVASVTNMAQLIGTFFSKQWVKQHVLRMTEEEIEEMDSQIEEERLDAQEKGIEPGIPGMGLPGAIPGAGMPGMEPQFGGQPMAIDDKSGEEEQGSSPVPPVKQKKKKPPVQESTEPRRVIRKFVASPTLTPEEQSLVEAIAKYEYVKPIESISIEESSNDTV